MLQKSKKAPFGALFSNHYTIYVFTTPIHPGAVEHLAEAHALFVAYLLVEVKK